MPLDHDKRSLAKYLQRLGVQRLRQDVGDFLVPVLLVDDLRPLVEPERVGRFMFRAGFTPGAGTHAVVEIIANTASVLVHSILVTANGGRFTFGTTTLITAGTTAITPGQLTGIAPTSTVQRGTTTVAPGVEGDAYEPDAGFAVYFDPPLHIPPGRRLSYVQITQAQDPAVSFYYSEVPTLPSANPD